MTMESKTGPGSPAGTSCFFLVRPIARIDSVACTRFGKERSTMKPFSVWLCLAASSLLLLFPTGCKKIAPDLIGTYSVKDDDGQLKVFIRVIEDGGKYYVSVKDQRKWLTPAEATPVEKEDLEKLINQPVNGEFSSLGNENVAVVKVAKGWKSGNFECKTGFWLASQLGPMDLYKN